MSFLNRGMRGLYARVFACLMMVVIVAGTGGVALAQETQQKTPADVYAENNTAVVTVMNYSAGGGLTGPQAQGAGSGFIITEDGYVVTNWHVVDGGSRFLVIFSDQSYVEAQLVGSDARDDLAVLKFDAGQVKYKFTIATLGNSDKVVPGEAVVAMGSPLGRFPNTITAGIVSGIGRDELNSQNPVCQQYTNMIQHDAAINHGNSGGPLFDLNGNVIGVNTLGIPTDAQGQPVQGLFFAVPSNVVKLAVDQIIASGQVWTNYTGLSYYDLIPAYQQTANTPVPYGALVISSEGPSADVGLQRNDIITHVNGTAIDESHTFGDLVNRVEPGATVTLTVIRGDQTTDVKLTTEAIEYDPNQCSVGGQ